MSERKCCYLRSSPRRILGHKDTCLSSFSGSLAGFLLLDLRRRSMSSSSWRGSGSYLYCCCRTCRRFQCQDRSDRSRDTLRTFGKAKSRIVLEWLIYYNKENCQCRKICLNRICGTSGRRRLSGSGTRWRESTDPGFCLYRFESARWESSWSSMLRDRRCSEGRTATSRKCTALGCSGTGSGRNRSCLSISGRTRGLRRNFFLFLF